MTNKIDQNGFRCGAHSWMQRAIISSFVYTSIATGVLFTSVLIYNAWSIELIEDNKTDIVKSEKKIDRIFSLLYDIKSDLTEVKTVTKNIEQDIKND